MTETSYAMTKDEILERLRAVLQETFEIPEERITPSARLYEDLNIDSIDAVDLMVRLRSLTERRLRPEAFRSVRTLGDVVDALHVQLTERD